MSINNSSTKWYSHSWYNYLFPIPGLFSFFLRERLSFLIGLTQLAWTNFFRESFGDKNIDKSPASVEFLKYKFLSLPWVEAASVTIKSYLTIYKFSYYSLLFILPFFAIKYFYNYHRVNFSNFFFKIAFNRFHIWRNKKEKSLIYPENYAKYKKFWF